MANTRKMLNNWQAPDIQSLMKLIETQSKQTLAAWAIGYCEQTLLPLWDRRRPGDPRPREALRAAREWLAGTIKLPLAKPAILACHEAAREAEDDPAAQAAARAIGQSASTIHSPRHSIGLAFYGALALAYDQLGTDTPWTLLEERALEECRRMEDTLRGIAVEDEPHPAKIDWKC